MNKPFNINTNTKNNHSNSNNSNTTTSNNNSKTTQLNSIIISKSIFEFYSLINFTFNNNSNENKLTSISLSSTSIKSKTAKITISNNYHTYTITYYISKDIFFRLTQNYEPSSYITETKLIDNEIEITFTFTLDNIINIFYHIDYEACIKSTEPLTSLQNKNVKIYFHLNHFDYTCTYTKKSKDNNNNTNTYSYTKHNVSLFIYRDFNDEINNMKFLFPIITFQLSMRHLLTMMFNDDIKDKFMKGNDEYNYHINITHNDISLNTCCSLKYENVLMCHFIYFCILVSYGVITYYELCAFMEKYANEVNALYQSNAAKFVLCLKMICKEHLHTHYKDKIPLTKEQLYNEIKKKINSNNSLSCVVSTYHGKDYCEIPVICVEQYFVRFEFYHKEKSFLFYRKYGNNDICRLNVVTNKVWNCKCKFTKQFLNGILKGFKLKNKIYSLLTYNVSQLNMFSCIMLSKNGSNSNSNGNSKQQFDLFMLENYFLPSKTIEFGNVNLQLKKDYKGKHNERQITLSQGVAPIMPEIISKISSQLNTNIKRLPYIHCFTSLYHKGIWMECKSSTHKQQQQQEITFYYRQSQNYPTTNNSNTSASMNVHSFNLHVIDYPVNKCYSNCYLTLEMVLYLIYYCKVSVACIYDLIEHNIKYYCTLLSQTSFYSNSHFIHRVLSSIQKYNLINNSFIYKIHKILLHTKQYTLIDHPKLIITNSAVLQGIVDEYGLIKNDNEVIVVLRNIYTNNMKLILKGKGILTRIPCIHASNFRKVYFYSPTNKQLTKHQLNAYNYYINNFHNVIIFPSYEHKHSLLNDLNVRSFASNKFGVIWDTNIVKSFHETKACDIMNNLLSTRNNTTTSASSSSSTCEYTITNFTTIAGKHFKHKISSQIEDLIEHNYLNSKLHSLSETLAKIEDMYYVYGNEEIKPITSLKKHFINKCIKKPIVKTIITNAKRYLEQERLHTPLYMNNDTKALMIHYIESHSHMIEFYIEKVNIILNYICVFNSKCNDVLNEIDETSYEGMFLTLFDKSKRYSVFVKEFVEEYNVDKVIKELTECKYKYDITLVMLVCAMISYNLVYHTCYMKDVYERYYNVVMNKQKQVIAQDVCVHCMEAFEYQMHSFGMGDNEKVQSLIYLLDTYTTVTYSNSGNSSSSSNEMTICESEYNKTINNFNILMNNKYGSNPFIPFCFSEYISILKISSEYNESI